MSTDMIIDSNQNLNVELDKIKSEIQRLKNRLLDERTILLSPNSNVDFGTPDNSVVITQLENELLFEEIKERILERVIVEFGFGKFEILKRATTKNLDTNAAKYKMISDGSLQRYKSYIKSKEFIEASFIHKATEFVSDVLKQDVETAKMFAEKAQKKFADKIFELFEKKPKRKSKKKRRKT